MLFQPARPDRLFWDCWLFYHDGQYHLFYQRKRAGEAQTFEVGHAISPDLVRWTEVPPAYVRGERGAWDAGPLRTGTTLRKGDRFYLINGAAEHRMDKLGVSTSSDLIHWEKYAGNPVSVPDPRWYEADAETCVLGNVAWRDPCILPDGDGYIAFLCARLKDGPVSTRGTIATLRSRDLLHWEAGPPVPVPADFVMLEVPDVFALDGRWFLLHSTTPRFGARIRTCDPNLVAGTHVLWADQRDGPYTRPPRDVLIGSSVELTSAWVCRTAESPLGRIAYYVNAYKEPLKGGRPHGMFGLPKGVAADARGLTLRYLPILEPYRGPAVIPPLVSARRETRRELPGEWTVADGAAEGCVAVGASMLPIEGEARDFILTARLTIEQGRAAGLGFRLNLWGDGLGVHFDTAAGTVAVTELATVSCGAVWRPLAQRQAPLRVGSPLAIRLVVLRDVVEVFLDDELLLSVVAEGYTEQGFALLADDARVRVDNVQVWPLQVPPPTDLSEGVTA